MNKIKTFLAGLQKSVKSIVKGVFYILGLLSFGYAIWYAIKNAKNGRGFLVNFIAGIIHGIGKVIEPALTVAFGDKKESVG